MDSMKLCLGSGNKPEKGPEWVNVDAESFGNNVVHDLDTFPWPFEDNSFDEIKAIDVLEHLDNPTEAINEMIRISKPNGKIKIQVPNAAYPEYWGIDPQHRRGFATLSLDYWERGNGLNRSFGKSHNHGKYFIKNLKVEKSHFVVHEIQASNLTFTFEKE